MNFRTWLRQVVIVCLMIVPLLLAGCGGIWRGSGGGDSTYSVQSLSTTIQGAETSSLDLETLRVRTSIGASAVEANGNSRARIFLEGPQLAEVVDAEGRTVFLSYLSPDQREFSYESTALALAYLALGGFAALPEGRLKILEELPEAAGFPALVSSIAQQHGNLGYLDTSDADIQAAVAALRSELTSVSNGVIAEPTTQSGISLDTTVDGKLGVENVYLRRVELMFRRIGYVTADRSWIPETRPFESRQMKLVDRYGGLLGTIGGLFTGDVPYSPKRLEPPLDIPRFPETALRTEYEVYAIGPGASRDQTLTNIPQEVIDAQDRVEIEALLLDIVLVFIANVAIPLEAEAVDDFLRFVNGNAAVTDLINTIKTTMPEVVNLLEAGEYTEAVEKFLTSAVTSNTILPAISQIALDWLETKFDLSQAQYDDLLGNFQNLLGIVGKVDIGVTLVDMGILFHDIAQSHKIDRFKITVTPGVITLSAAKTTIKPTATTVITATIQDRDPDGTYEYHWTVSPNANYWVEDRFLNGTDDANDGILKTAESQVNIRSFVTTEGVATVRCEAYRLDGGRRKVGDDDIDITFDPDAVNSTVFIGQVKPEVHVYLGTVGRYYFNFATHIMVPRTEGATRYILKATSSIPEYRTFEQHYVPSVPLLNDLGHLVNGGGVFLELYNREPSQTKVFLFSTVVTNNGGSPFTTEGDARAAGQAYLASHMPSVNAGTVYRIETIFPD